jgi:hypothetical protein
MTHPIESNDIVVDLGAASELTRGVPTWMHEESTGEMDYRD